MRVGRIATAILLAGSAVLKALTVKRTVFWNVTPYSL
jgi:hypothetical protein